MKQEITPAQSHHLKILSPTEDGDRYSLVAAYLRTQNSSQGRRGIESTIRKLSQVYFESLTGEIPEIPEKIEIWSLVPWHQLTAAGVDLLMEGITGAPNTRRHALSALKGIARAGYRMDVISSDSWTKIHSTKGPKGSRLSKGRKINDHEIRALFEACDLATATGMRDAAMIAFAIGTGARREEIVGIGMNDFADLPTRFGQALTGALIGKGDKERTFYVLDQYRDRILDWISVRGSEPGSLFCRTTRHDHIYPGDSISTTAAHKALMRRVADASLSNISWHDFRRTLITNLRQRGADFPTIARIVGHSSVETTMGYDQGNEEEKLEALSKLR